MNKKKDIEIEIKVRVENVKNLLTFLQKNAKFISSEHQIDTYYTPAHKNFIAPKPVDEWLRLRDSSGKYFINYKNWHHDKEGKSDFCDEFETELKDIKQVEKIFNVLDIRLLTVVDKDREIWRYKDYELAIDSVKNVGDFLELEFKGKQTSKTPRQITLEMIEFLKSLNLGKIIRDYVGYPHHLLFPNDTIEEEL